MIDMADRTCTIEGCGRSVHARGWCHTHYSKWHKRGDPMHTRPSMEERFWSKVDVGHPLGCWTWTQTLDQDGYGRFWMKDGYPYAHRVAYELLVGPVPDGLQIDHLCRNRACVNPDHLEPVTPKENQHRGFGFSGKNRLKTHCPQGHPYSGANIIASSGRRACRTCVNDRQTVKRIARRAAKKGQVDGHPNHRHRAEHPTA